VDSRSPAEIVEDRHSSSIDIEYKVFTWTYRVHEHTAISADSGLLMVICSLDMHSLLKQRVAEECLLAIECSSISSGCSESHAKYMVCILH